MSARSGGSDVDRVWQTLVGMVMDSRGDWRRGVAEATGIPFSRARALRRLTDGPKTLRDLAYTMDIDAPAATVIVDDLERRGLVERHVHPDDKRSKLVSITAAGKKTLLATRTVTDRAPLSLQSLPPEDIAELVRILAPLAKR